MAMKFWQLSGLNPMPLFGLGTYRLTGDDLVYKTVEAALKVGYRLIDTAGIYRNEGSIGVALKELLPKYGLERKDVFITSKLAPQSQGREKSRAACLKSMQDLQTDYLDLYLIHWPGAAKIKPDDSLNAVLRKESWLELEKLHNEGKLRNIGVSNYNVEHLKELLAFCKVKPVVLQSEYHPHLLQDSVIQFCKENDIHFQAYSSFGTMDHNDQLLSDPVVCEVAQKYGKTTAQVLLRWPLQQNIGVLPKSANAEHIRANMDIFDFELSESDMKALSSIHKNKHYAWNPEGIV